MTVLNIPQQNGGVFATTVDSTEVFECVQGGVNKPISLATFIGAILGLVVIPSNDTSGITDLSNMNSAAAKAVASIQSYVVPPGSTPSNFVSASYQLTGGTFYLTSACPLLNASLTTHNTYGITVRGMGEYATRIDYNPTVAGTPFLTNQFMIGATFLDMSFIGHDITADFLLSAEGSGGGGNIQDYNFQRCIWWGNWNNIFNLTGTNNNSEWKVSNCRNQATMAATGSWLNIGTLNTSDQFLNFWFDDCCFNAKAGSWVTMNKGGSVGINRGDASGWTPSTPTYLFNLLGATHASGVMSFDCSKLRMEMKTANTLFLHLQWGTSGQGNVSFNNVDQSSQVGVFPAATTSCLVEIGNTAGVSIEFANSNFIGQHTYSYNSNAFSFQNNISYKSCNILQYGKAADFVVFNEVSTNKGGAPVVDFDINCRGNDPSEIFPTTLNWQFSTAGITQPKTVQFTGPNASAPSNLSAISRKLPPNAVLRSVNWNLGGTVAGAYGFAMQSSEAVPTVFSTFAGANAATPANPAATPCNFWMLTDQQRTIQLIETAGRTATFNNYIASVTYDG